MATNNRKLKGNRNKDGDLMRFMGSMSTQDMIDADIPIHVPKLVKDEQPKTMDEHDSDPTLDADIKDLEDRIKAWRDSELSKNKQARMKASRERTRLMAEELKETKAREKLLDEEIAESRARQKESKAQTLASEARTKLMKETAKEDYNNRNLTGERNKDGDLIPENAHPTDQDLTEAIKDQDWKDNSIVSEGHNKRILNGLREEFGFEKREDLIQSPEFQEVHGDKYNNLFALEVTVRKSFPDDLEKDEVKDKPDWNKMPDRQKTTTKGMLKKTDIKPGWKKNEGSNFWNVDSESPYWQTEEGYQEAMKVWGKKPGWIKRGSGDKPYASKSSGR
jgi:hypothetical protein